MQPTRQTRRKAPRGRDLDRGLDELEKRVNKAHFEKGNLDEIPPADLAALQAAADKRARRAAKLK